MKIYLCLNSKGRAAFFFCPFQSLFLKKKLKKFSAMNLKCYNWWTFVSMCSIYFLRHGRRCASFTGGKRRDSITRRLAKAERNTNKMVDVRICDSTTITDWYNNFTCTCNKASFRRKLLSPIPNSCDEYWRMILLLLSLRGNLHLM